MVKLVSRRGKQHVLHIIAAIDLAGAETALGRTIDGTARCGWEHTVINLCAAPAVEAAFAQAGARVVSLGWHQHRWPGISALGTLRRVIRESHASVAMGWMYHGAFAAILGTLWGYSAPSTLWAIRCGVSRHDKLTTKMIRWVLAMTCRFPARVIFVSKRGQDQHRSLGFSRSHALFLPNGYDTDRFRPQPELRDGLRRELGISPSAKVIAWVGRWHLDKAPHSALRAFRKAKELLADLHMLMVGTGCDATGSAGGEAREIGGGNVHLLGRREDIPCVLAAVDVLLLSSHSEAFPNIIAEAMACEVPCVSTDVGDVRDMIAETGVVVPIDDTSAMAHGLVHLLSEEEALSRARRLAGRRRIVGRYGLSTSALRYDRIWNEVIEESRCRS